MELGIQQCITSIIDAKGAAFDMITLRNTLITVIPRVYGAFYYISEAVI